MSTWNADIDIDIEIAHRAISLQFPDFVGLTPTSLGEGWDNLCVAYPNGIAFRLPRRQVAVPLIDIEWNVLPKLGPLLPLPIPVPILRGDPTEGYPYPFLGFGLLPGETADRVTLSEPRGAAIKLAETLAILHSIDPSTLSLPGDHIHRKDPTRLRERFEARWAELPDEERARWGEGLAAWVQETAETVRPTPTLCVVHGDLYPRHLLVHEAELAGIIDWGDVHLGHPSMDLSVMFTAFDPDLWPSFLSAYGRAVSEEDLRLARLRAAMYGTALLAYGLDVSDDSITECGRTILDRVARHG